MYSKEDLAKVNAQIRRERLACYLPAALLIAGGIAAFILRMKYLTMALLALGGVLFIFSADVLIAPLKAYRRHLENALNSDQKESVEVVHNLFAKEMMNAGASSAEEREDMMQKAITRDLAYMRSILTTEQYRIYLQILNATLKNRGLK